MALRRPPLIALAAALVAVTFAAGYFITDPGSQPRRGLPPQSAIEPQGAQAFAARAVRPAAATPAGASSGVAAAAASPPPEQAGRRSPALLFLDHRAVAPNAFDRYGNPPRRDLSHDELVRIASEYDLIDDNLRGQPDGIPLTMTEMDEMRRINPRLKVVRYLWTLSNNDAALSNIEPGDNTHEAWFLRDAAGDYVRAYDGSPSWNRHVNYVFDPANTNVRIALGAQARVARKLGYDGVLLDDVLPYVAAPGAPHARAVLQAHPLDPMTGAPYTDEAWRAAVAGLIERVREIAGPGTYVIASGMTGSDYFAAHGDALLPAVDAVLLHPFTADDIGAAATQRWLDDAAAVEEIGAHGKTAIAYAPGASAAAPERQERIDRYAFASYLITLGDVTPLYGQAAPEGVTPEAYAVQPSYRLAPLGPPQGQRHEFAGLHVRRFEHGIVIVNPDAVAHEIPLPGRYHTPDGVAVAGSLALPAHDSIILVTDP